MIAVAVQDHGDPLDLCDGVTPRRVSPTSNATAAGDDAVRNRVRFEYLSSLLAADGDLVGMVYHEPPDGMTRLAELRETVLSAHLMDTGAAPVLGAMGDPVVEAAAASDGAILVNVGNMRTFAVLVLGRSLFGRG